MLYQKALREVIYLRRSSNSCIWTTPLLMYTYLYSGIYDVLYIHIGSIIMLHRAIYSSEMTSLGSLFSTIAVTRGIVLWASARCQSIDQSTNQQPRSLQSHSAKAFFTFLAKKTGILKSLMECPRTVHGKSIFRISLKFMNNPLNNLADRTRDKVNDRLRRLH